MEKFVEGLQEFEMDEARAERVWPKVESIIVEFYKSLQKGDFTCFKPPLRPFAGGSENVLVPFDLNNPFFAELIMVNQESLPKISTCILSQPETDLLLVQNSTPLIPGSLMLVCAGMLQESPLPENFSQLSDLDQESYLNAFAIAEQLANNNFVAIVNGPFCGSISNFHIQLLNLDNSEGVSLQRRSFDPRFYLKRDEAMRIMRKMWENSAYATCTILCSEKYVVNALCFEENKPLAFNSASEYFSNPVSLNLEQQADLLLMMIYNPGGFETDFLAAYFLKKLGIKSKP
jgi:hypothetical protein